MGSSETSRQPCPDRILDDAGGAFAMGAVGGSLWHFLKGVYNSPGGERLLGGSQSVRMNVPRFSGSWAVWGALFSVFDCSMVYIRQKEDPWNSIIAGAATGGFLRMRQGLGPATRYAAFGGAILALAHGLSIMLTKMSTVPYTIQMEKPIPNMAGGPGFPMGQQQHFPVSTPVTADSTGEYSSSFRRSSWFGGFFGTGDKDKETSSSSGINTDSKYSNPDL
ncbi:hypothetical protein H6P81_009047 [Aristolochia fimbriata]|uniref:Mitochondrial import inner membrane translocase subunit TIM17-2-like n=1 Tax=Aristolochia fimbriata TaxID=158543 RepID=A0AAV7EN80_ARIFI|nr:hypothetical protein H6P81_009047 [Aristolochia fimbriata]